MQSYQRFQHIVHTVFNTSGTNASHLLPLTKVGTHSALLKGSHTAAHTAKQGPSLPRPQCGFVPPVKYLIFRHAFIYIHFPVLCDPHYIKSGRVAATNAVPQPFLIAVSTSLTNGPRLLSQAKVGTHSAFRERSHTRAHTAKQGAFRMGVVSLLSERSARSPTSPGRVSERQVLPLLGLGRGCSQRTQKAFGTAMRLCASLSRGVAAPLGCVIFSVSVEIAACTPCAQDLSACAR